MSLKISRIEKAGRHQMFPMGAELVNSYKGDSHLWDYRLTPPSLTAQLVWLCFGPVIQKASQKQVGIAPVISPISRYPLRQTLCALGIVGWAPYHLFL
ncbi:hypothetical protein [Rufibacter roseus]|uniref:Uncharacterized protein n=1 Tax=Rufibacter roseus TaxID=1567108 RepID=A0ABW2DLB1_9BACT|nr:hypothetical protein [Rufibacter roseus]